MPPRSYAGPGRRHLRDGQLRLGLEVLRHHRPGRAAAPDPPATAPDPLNPDNYWSNSVENQEHVRTYVKVEVRNDKLVVENIRSGTCAARTRRSSTAVWCANTTAASRSARSSTRSTIHPYHGDGQDIQVDVPERRPRASSAGRSTATTAWSTSARPPSSNGDYFEAAGRDQPDHGLGHPPLAARRGRSSARSATSGTATRRSPASTSAGRRTCFAEGAGAAAGDPVDVRLRRTGTGPVGLARPRLGRRRVTRAATPSSAPTWT